MFGNGPVSFKSLPIVPLNLAKDCNEGYLHNRGYKSAQLRSATFITYSEDKIPGVSRYPPHYTFLLISATEAYLYVCFMLLLTKMRSGER